MRIISLDNFVLNFSDEMGTELSFRGNENGIEVSFDSNFERSYFFACENQLRRICIEQLIEAVDGEALMDIDESDIKKSFETSKNGKFYSFMIDNKSKKDVIKKIRAVIEKDILLLIRIEGNISMLDFNEMSNDIDEDREEDILYNWTENEEYRDLEARISLWTREKVND